MPGFTRHAEELKAGPRHCSPWVYIFFPYSTALDLIDSVLISTQILLVILFLICVSSDSIAGVERSQFVMCETVNHSASPAFSSV